MTLLRTLLLPAIAIVLVNCTLTIQTTSNPGSGTGLGSGVVNVKDGTTTVAVCTITEGTPQADCVQNINAHDSQTFTLEPSPGSGSQFGGWTGDCVLVVADICTIEFSPTQLKATVRADFKALSCQGTDACTNLVMAPPGEGSCNGPSACYDANGPVGNNSCVFLTSAGACYAVAASIGNNSCKGHQACYSAGGAIAGGSCNGLAACQLVAGSVGANSCNATSACTATAAPSIGNNSCNTTSSACRSAITAIGDCVHNDVKPVACP